MKKKTSTILKMVIPAMMILMLSITSFSQEKSSSKDVEDQMKRLRKELFNMQQERNQIRQERDKDRKDFEQYRNTTLRKIHQINHETDSVKFMIANLKYKEDSLHAALETEKSKQKEFEILQDGFRSRMVRSCDSLMKSAAFFPPGVAEKYTATISLLKNELSTKSIDNAEAIGRFFQISRDLNENTQSVSVTQESSPLPEIRGMVYRIRMGSIFLAIVNGQGTQSAVWRGWKENREPAWEFSGEGDVSTQLLKIANIREGKTLPSLVQLPIGNHEIATITGAR